MVYLCTNCHQKATTSLFEHICSGHLASAASCEDPAGNAVATEAKAAWDIFPQTIVEVENNMTLDPMEKDFLGCSQVPFFHDSGARVIGFWTTKSYPKQLSGYEVMVKKGLLPCGIHSKSIQLSIIWNPFLYYIPMDATVDLRLAKAKQEPTEALAKPRQKYHGSMEVEGISPLWGINV